MQPIVQHSRKGKTAEQIKNIRGLAFFFCITIVLLVWIQYTNLQQFLSYTDTQIQSIGVFFAPELIYCNFILCICRNLNIERVEVTTVGSFRFRTLDTNFTRSISGRIKVSNIVFLGKPFVFSFPREPNEPP